MKKVLFFMLLASLVWGQVLKVTSTKELTIGGEGYYPKFSPDGKAIYFTQSGFKGIKAYDLTTQKVKEITSEAGAGYEFAFTMDGKSVVYRTDKYVDGLKYSTLKMKNLETNSENILVSDSRNVSPAVVTEKNTIAYTQESKLNKLKLNQNVLEKTVTSDDIFVKNEDLKIALYINGTRKVLQPLGEGNYIWISLSPDKTKILFTRGDRGTFICDLNGNIIEKFAKGIDAPKWSPDGTKILYMNDKDNGVNYTSSEIMVYDIATKLTQQVTNSNNEVKMYPEWSVNGNSIVYNTTDGKIYLLNIESK